MDRGCRYDIKEMLGEGSFSKALIYVGKIYKAFDKKLNMDVALKIEKEDKHKKILKLEYEILKNLQGNFISNKRF